MEMSATRTAKKLKPENNITTSMASSIVAPGAMYDLASISEAEVSTPSPAKSPRLYSRQMLTQTLRVIVGNSFDEDFTEDELPELKRASDILTAFWLRGYSVRDPDTLWDAPGVPERRFWRPQMLRDLRPRRTQERFAHP
jgi:hypothetical protein